MRKIFVSGCYDILHGGHIEFFREAKALGDHLTVCFAGEAVLFKHKQRRPSLPDGHKRALIESIDCVDTVVIGENTSELGLDFIDHFKVIKPNVLVVTEDDKYESVKRALCETVQDCLYHRLEKTPPPFEPISTTQILSGIRAPSEVPLRVDFGGGWLDVPRYARPNSFIVNCAISPLVSFSNWPYERSSGLGGSAAWAALRGGAEESFANEERLGVGWQDPAIVMETGLCVWRSGQHPSLDLKTDGAWLRGRMALVFTGIEHNTPSNVDNQRDFDIIQNAGDMAREAVLMGATCSVRAESTPTQELRDALASLIGAMRLSYMAQLHEGMVDVLKDGEICESLETAYASGECAIKYCGGGFGGYVLVLFTNAHARDHFVGEDEKEGVASRLKIEPYIRNILSEQP